MASFLFAREVHVPAEVPRAGMIINAILSMVTFAVLSVCLTRRIQATRNWSTIPVTRWILFAIYTDSLVFILVTAILWNGFGLNSNAEICDSSILMCITCYLSTKILIYYFLVEKVYIIRRVNTPRLKSKLYIFNCFGMLLPYCVVVVLNYIYRISYFNEQGVCIIGMQKKSMMPLIIFDAVVNLYLTMLFVIPLRGLYSYKHTPNSALKTVAIRSFFGALATLTSSVVNLTVLMVLHGEPAWVCLMCCNADVLFSVVVLHWVTSKDSSSTSSTTSRSGNAKNSTPNKMQYPFSGSSKNVPTVTTHISAVRGDDDNEDVQRLDWGRRAAAKEGGEYELGGLRVQVGRRVEVASECGVTPPESAADNDGISRGRSQRTTSTEELVDRDRILPV